YGPSSPEGPGPGSVVLQEFQHAPQLLSPIDVSVASARILATLHEGNAPGTEIGHLLLHALHLKGDVVQAVAMPVELVLPRAWLANRLDQLDIHLPHVEERQLGAGLRWLTLVFGADNVDAV